MESDGNHGTLAVILVLEIFEAQITVSMGMDSIHGFQYNLEQQLKCPLELALCRTAKSGNVGQNK